MTRRTRRLPTLAAVGVLAVGLAACGDDDSSSSVQDGAPPVEVAPPGSTPAPEPAAPPETVPATPEPTATTGTPVPPPADADADAGVDVDDDVRRAPEGERARAEAAAIEAVGGESPRVVAIDVEDDADDRERWKIDVRRSTGVEFEVTLDRELRVIDRERDDRDDDNDD